MQTFQEEHQPHDNVVPTNILSRSQFIILLRIGRIMHFFWALVVFIQPYFSENAFLKVLKQVLSYSTIFIAFFCLEVGLIAWLKYRIKPDQKERGEATSDLLPL